MTDAQKKQVYARHALRPSVNAASIVNKYGKFLFGDIIGQDALASTLANTMTEINSGNMKRVENMLLGRANISQGHQQVNNGVPVEASRAHEEKTINSNELLETSNGKRVDTRMKSKAGRNDPQMATVETGRRQNT